MKKAIIAGLLSVIASTANAGTNCVDYDWADWGFDSWINNCSYTVVIRGTFNNGYLDQPNSPFHR